MEWLRPLPDGRAQGAPVQPTSLREPSRVGEITTHQIWGAVKPLEMKGFRLFEATKSGISGVPLSSDRSSTRLQIGRTMKRLNFQDLELIWMPKQGISGEPLL